MCVCVLLLFFLQNFAECLIAAINKEEKIMFRTVHNETKKSKQNYAIGYQSQSLMYVKVHQGTYLAP